MIMENGEAPLTLQDIAAIEAALGLRFPRGLRDSYLRSNGGRPDPYVYEDDTLDTVVSEALPLTAVDEDSTAVATYRALVLEKQLVPAHFFPFAVDGGGNYFFVDCHSSDASVYFFDHDTAGEHVRALDIGIDEFWNRLKGEDE
jgi:cell wall assembly regulator SMI1